MGARLKFWRRSRVPKKGSRDARRGSWNLKWDLCVFPRIEASAVPDLLSSLGQDGVSRIS